MRDRFWPKVDRTAGPDGCWLWVGCRDKLGYGRFGWERKVWFAHRYSWSQNKGSIPEGMYVCHRCDTPSCVNPAHLFLGTQTDNMRDMAKKGRGNAPSGERHVRAKLTREKAQLVRSLYVRGSRELGTVALGRIFGVSDSTIGRTVAGKIWGIR